MSEDLPNGSDGSDTARALPTSGLIDSPRRCPACGTALTGRQRACSAKCRAALSRRRRAQAQAERDRQIRDLLKVALALLE